MARRGISRRTFLRGTAAGMGGLALSQALPHRAAAAPEIRIGTIFPLSGPMALLGEEMFRGVEMAAEMINEKGGILGGQVVYVKGDAPDATAATSEAERLINVEKVKVILGTYSSSLAYAASQVGERYKVPYWEVAANADPITERGFQYFFGMLSPGSSLGVVAADYAANVVAPMFKLNPKEMRIGQLYEDTMFGTVFSGGARTRAKQLDLNVVLSETYSQKAVDLSSIVLKLKALKPDIIIATQYISDGILFWRQAKELGLDVKALIGTGGAHSLPDFVMALGDDANHVLTSDAPVGLNTANLTPRAQQELKTFNERFNKKHGHIPAVHAGQGYNGAMVLLRDVLPKAGALDPDKIREAANQLDIADGDTIYGYGVKFAPPGHKNAGANLRCYPMVNQWQDGNLYVVSPEKWATRKVILPLPTWEERRKK